MRGFTVIELMVTLSILAILAGIAVPSLALFLERGSLNSAAGELHAAISRARQEAITRNTFVTVQIRSGTDWSNGYQIFVNPSNLPVYTVGDSIGGGTSVVSASILAVSSPSTLAYVIWPPYDTQSQPVQTCFTFDDLGRPYTCATGARMGSGRVMVSTNHHYCKEMIVDALGRVQVTSPPTAMCP